MKLVRHGAPGKEKPGILDADGQVRDLSGICDDFGPAFFAKDGLRAVLLFWREHFWSDRFSMPQPVNRRGEFQ